MKILLLGPIHREKEYLKESGKSHFPRFQAQSSWVSALEALGHKISVFRYTDSILIPNNARVYIKDFFERFLPTWTARFLRIKSKFYFLSLENFLRNKKLLALANKVKPELVLISGGSSNIYPSTIKKIKDKYICKMLLFSGINPNIAATNAEKIMVKNGTIDIVVENDKGYAKSWEKLGTRKTIVLPISSVDPKIHRRVKLSKEEQKEYSSDVCFVGTLLPDRQQILSKLLDFDIKIWGDMSLGIKLDEKLKPHYYGTAFGEKMVKIFNAAKIVLNFQPMDMTHGGNMRTFEIPGCGAFQLADRIDNDWFDNDKDYIRFKNIKDLKDKIGYCLRNEKERKRIARNGYVKSRREHTYQKHFQELLRTINEKN